MPLTSRSAPRQKLGTVSDASKESGGTVTKKLVQRRSRVCSRLSSEKHADELTGRIPYPFSTLPLPPRRAIGPRQMSDWQRGRPMVGGGPNPRSKSIASNGEPRCVLKSLSHLAYAVATAWSSGWDRKRRRQNIGGLPARVSPMMEDCFRGRLSPIAITGHSRLSR